MYDTACPHTACQTQKLVNRFRWEIFKHPRYALDLLLNDFHLFTHSKVHLGRKGFKGKIMQEFNSWLQKRDPLLYKIGLEKFSEHFDKLLPK